MLRPSDVFLKTFEYFPEIFECPGKNFECFSGIFECFLHKIPDVRKINADQWFLIVPIPETIHFRHFQIENAGIGLNRKVKRIQQYENGHLY
jgi:hypothetical protein